jgi:hypothetical protein
MGPEGAGIVVTDGQTDRHNKPKGGYRNFANTPKKSFGYHLQKDQQTLKQAVDFY